MEEEIEIKIEYLKSKNDELFCTTLKDNIKLFKATNPNNKEGIVIKIKNIFFNMSKLELGEYTVKGKLLGGLPVDYENKYIVVFSKRKDPYLVRPIEIHGNKYNALITSINKVEILPFSTIEVSFEDMLNTFLMDWKIVELSEQEFKKLKLCL